MICFWLKVGQWIAQWDAPYEAWYYYNSQSGKVFAKISSTLIASRSFDLDEADRAGGYWVHWSSAGYQDGQREREGEEWVEAQSRLSV